jgi:hypothetical protein
MRVFVSSFEVAGRSVDKGKICPYCGPGHNEEVIARELRRCSEANLLLPDVQRAVLDLTREFCNEHGLEMEVVDMAGLRFLDKVKLAFRGIRAPSILCAGNRISGMPSKEQLRVLSLSSRAKE